MRASSTVSASDHLDDDNVVLMDVVEATTAATNEDIGTVETAENGEQPVLERDLELELDKQPASAAIPPLLCEGYVPDITELFQNFPFQLLPSLPHVVLCGTSFHHQNCMNGQFQIQTTTNSGVNDMCMSLEKDEKLSKVLSRADLPLQYLPPQIQYNTIQQTFFWKRTYTKTKPKLFIKTLTRTNIN